MSAARSQGRATARGVPAAVTASTPGPTPIVHCARHPDVETGLSCGRCGTPICPRCLVYTPAGTRCPDCAMLRRPPMYELAPRDYARAIAAAAVLVVPLAIAALLAGSVLGSLRFLGFFGLLIMLFAGSAGGEVVARVLDWATNRKRGVPMQTIATAAIIAAALLRLVLAGAPVTFVLRDIAGDVLAAAAIVVAWSRLR